MILISRSTFLTAFTFVAALSGCNNLKKNDEVKQSPETASETSAKAGYFSNWAGKWVGPEGLYIIVTPLADAQFTLEMQSDLDTNAKYDGNTTPDGIRFIRGGEAMILKRASGDETGLKYLSGKKDCLMVQNGEGYCRD